MIIFSIKNEKLNYFNRPVYFDSVNECLNYIQNVMLSDADRVLSSLRGDLNLYKLGEIDFSTGTILNDLEPFCIASLDSIFDSIPKEHIPRTEKQLREEIDKLKIEIESISNSFAGNLDRCFNLLRTDNDALKERIDLLYTETKEKFEAYADELAQCKKIKK